MGIVEGRQRGAAPGLPSGSQAAPARAERSSSGPSGKHSAAQEPYEAAGELLRALAAPIRVAIVTELATGQRCVHELVDALGVTQPLVSQHLRVLRGAGVVRGARRGREIAYSLVDEHIAHIVADAVSHAGERRTVDVVARAADASEVTR